MNSKKFDKYKYKSVTTVLSQVYSEYINVDHYEMIETTKWVLAIFKEIEKAMCAEDPLFERLFQKTTINGSVGDGLKVLLPDEYDLNLELKLPSCFTVFPSNIPGYIHLKEKECTKNATSLTHLPNYLKSTEDSYLLPKQLLPWIQSLLSRALNTFPTNPFGHYKINTKYGVGLISGMFKIKPGFTLQLGLIDIDVNIDIVACFMCKCRNLPEKYRRQITKGTCQLVPREPNRDEPHIERYWRLSFQNYERSMMRYKHFLKPTIKLLKVLKENLGINSKTICSYHIKSICLYEVQKAQHEFWKEPLSNCFLRLLRACIYHIGNRNIPAVYDARCNLIEHVDISTCKSISSKLQSVLEEIESKDDPRVVAQYLLNQEEFEEFCEDFEFSRAYAALLSRRDESKTGIRIFDLFKKRFIYN